MNPTNTIFDSKCLIKRRTTDFAVTSDKKHWPFKVVNRNGHLTFKVMHKGRVKLLCTEEILAMVLAKLKKSAVAYLGVENVNDAVVTVPALFNNFQCQAIKDACTIAGLNGLRIISEPTAAALAYGMKSKLVEGTKVVILDIGGAFVSVSVLTIADGIFEVKSTAGDSNFGGEDFTNRMITHFIDEFRKKYRKDLTSSEKAVQRLCAASEKAKHSLSTSNEARIEIDSLFEGVDFYTTITRCKFEDINNHLFYAILGPAERALRDSTFTKEQIHDVVLVGGST